MNKQQEEIRDHQKQSWNEFSAGWKKWDTLTMDFMLPVGKAMIAVIDPGGTDKILDIAAGTGEPGLTMAGMLQGGKVVITDLSPDMLVIAKENAEKRGITNVEFTACDVSALPFPDNSFDAVSCRFGFMFFPDMQMAAGEMLRVLKKGGRLAAAVWNTPDKNFWVTAMMGAINKNIALPASAPGSPGMFRCAGTGTIKTIFETAGFINITEHAVPTKMNAGTIDNYWNMMTEVAAPVVAALGKADPETTATIKSEVFASIREKYGETGVAVDASALVFSAEK